MKSQLSLAVALAVGAGALAPGCGSSGSKHPAVCEPGERQDCRCPATSVLSSQECLENASGWADCECGDGGAPGSGGTEPQGSGGANASGGEAQVSTGGNGVGGADASGGAGGARGARCDAAYTNPTIILIDSVTLTGGAGAGGAGNPTDPGGWEFETGLSSWYSDPDGGNVDATATWVDTGDSESECASDGCVAFSVALCTLGNDGTVVMEFAQPHNLMGQILTVRVYVQAGTGGYAQVFVTDATGEWEGGTWDSLWGISGWQDLVFDLSTLSEANVTLIDTLGLRIASE